MEGAAGNLLAGGGEIAFSKGQGVGSVYVLIYPWFELGTI